MSADSPPTVDDASQSNQVNSDAALISDVIELRDEFQTVQFNDSYSDVSRALLNPSTKVVLVQEKRGNDILGVITGLHFLKVCATGINPERTSAGEHMLSSILILKEDIPLLEARILIENSNVDAVIVVGQEGEFVGYLSPSDSRDVISHSEEYSREIPESPSKESDVLRPIPYSSDEHTMTFPITHHDGMMAIATRHSGTVGHGVRMVHVNGARIESLPKIVEDGARSITLWSMSSVVAENDPSQIQLEVMEDVQDHNVLLLLMDADSARRLLAQESWERLVERARPFPVNDQR